MIGRVCVKVTGREAGKKCVIASIIDKNFVLITGPKSLTGVKRRKVNILHLAFTPYTIDIKNDASDEEILKAIEKAGLIEYFKKEVRIKEGIPAI
jgi:large subunit ribosomal protein L14e